MKIIYTLLFLLLNIGTACAQATAPWNQGTQLRYGFGNTMCLTANIVDTCYPLYAPPTGSYAVKYVGSASSRGIDDFSTLDCSTNNQGGANPASVTYTLPASFNVSFTGSISGTTLTTPGGWGGGIGALITGAGVAVNTYVTAGSGTSWTVNNSQTVGSETMVAAQFPPGHGVTIVNFSNSQSAPAICTVTAASGSAIIGAAGVTCGNPSVPGVHGAAACPHVLFPGGRISLQSDSTGDYRVEDFDPGIWTKFSSSAAISYTLLSGYYNYHLHCHGVIPGTDSLFVRMQLAYGGTLQTAGYHYTIAWPREGTSAFGGATDQPYYVYSTASGGAGDTSIVLTSQLSNNGPSNIDGAAIEVDIASANGTGGFYLNTVTGTATAHLSTTATGGGPGIQQTSIAATGPYSNTGTLTGFQVYTGASPPFASAMCSLRPKP